MALPMKHIGTHFGSVMGHQKCDSYLLFRFEASLGGRLRTTLYFFGLAYCFIGLSAITARFFRSMENVVKHSREVVVTDPITKAETVTNEKVWNFAIADISLLAFGTSFPQISLATIDAIRNLGSLYAGGLGPGTLVGSAAFDLFPIHAVCVIIPKAGQVKKIPDIGVWLVELFWSFWAYIWLYIILKVWTPDEITLLESSLTVLQYGLLLIHAYAQDKRWPYISLPFSRSDRPVDWVPVEDSPRKNVSHNQDHSNSFEDGDCVNRNTVDIFSIHSDDGTGTLYQAIPPDEITGSPTEEIQTNKNFKPNKMEGVYMWLARFIWYLLCLPWRVMFAFVPPYQIAHGWIAFICSLIFISGIAYVVTEITDLISCVTGINGSVIALTALAAGTSWPDLVASKIAAERQTTADSAIANITCSNSVNIYVGIGVPWLIDTAYNYFAYRESLKIQNATGLSFSLLIFFCTSVGCIAVLVIRRLVFGGELGGPRIWAWITSAFFMFLWLIFVTLSSLKVSGYLD